MKPTERNAPTALLRVLLGAVLFSTVGFATVGMHPEWLAHFPPLVPHYAASLAVAAQALLYLAFVVLAVFLCRDWQWKWLPAFACVYSLSFLCEYCGAWVSFSAAPGESIW